MAKKIKAKSKKKSSEELYESKVAFGRNKRLVNILTGKRSRT